MSLPLLIASILVGIVVVCIGIYRAYSRGEFMPMILGMLILVSCAAIYIKRQEREQGQSGPEDRSLNDRH